MRRILLFQVLFPPTQHSSGISQRKKQKPHENEQTRGRGFCYPPSKRPLGIETTFPAVRGQQFPPQLDAQSMLCLSLTLLALWFFSVTLLALSTLVSWKENALWNQGDWDLKLSSSSTEELSDCRQVA